MIFQCKLCGGDLEVQEKTSVGVCLHCGSQMTIPNINDEKILNLFNRANRLRMRSEFDNARAVYENIITEDEKNAEAYWGICLCKYGIEYVTDQKTEQKIPTCHRNSYVSILQDEDFACALEYADSVARSVYQREAEEIERIQKKLLEVSAKEEPYDIFICYKESDDSGKRTKDSVYAQDIYYELTKRGYRVFFSRISLAKRIGKEYEPYIFSALNSANIMIVVGTSEQYMKAPWVKNEWSRFILMMQERPEKSLIPVYRNMDPYDMPEEFLNLQALNMERIGFMQDLLEGITKLLHAEESAKEEKTVTVVEQVKEAGENVKPLVQRAFIFLEDKNWSKANEYAERVLDHDPYCGEAYLVKLMLGQKVSREEQLAELDTPFANCDEYKKIVKYGDAALVERIKGYNQAIEQRIKQRKEEKKRKEEEKKRLEQERWEKAREERIRLRKEKEAEYIRERENRIQEIKNEMSGLATQSQAVLDVINKCNSEGKELERQKQEIEKKYLLANVVFCVIAVLVAVFGIMALINIPEGESRDAGLQVTLTVAIPIILLIANFAAAFSETSDGYTLITSICQLLNMGEMDKIEARIRELLDEISHKKKEFAPLNQKMDELSEELAGYEEAKKYEEKKQG